MTWRRRVTGVLGAVGWATSAFSPAAAAEDNAAWAEAAPLPQEPDITGSLQESSPSHAPEVSSDHGAAQFDLQHALEEGALDLGIVARVVSADALDDEFERRAKTGESSWLLAHRATSSGDHWRLEITAVAPESLIRRTAVDVVDASRAEVRAMVLLRETVRAMGEAPTATVTPTTPTLPPTPRSTGRAILALNTALLGGGIGVSLHQAGASEDNRLLYPLAALGVGIGLGASMLIADEWDITLDDAWMISAGMVWPATSGVLLAASYDVNEEHRYLYGLSGTAVGVTLATIAVAKHRVYEGSATLTHSGAAFGWGLGALTEGIIQGDLINTPLRGMGYGTGLGVLVAGVAATQVETSSSRVLLVDLAALLGGLTGGALATPLLLVDHIDETRRRLWFGSVALGTAAGALLGVLATRDDTPSHSAEGKARPGSAADLVAHWAPHAGLIGFSEEGSRRAPAWGAGVQGLW